MAPATVSELIAEEYFSARGIRWDRIPRTSEPTADYRLSVGHESTIAEVKEFGPSGRRRDGGFCP